MIDEYSIIDNNYGQYILLDDECYNEKSYLTKNNNQFINDNDIDNINDSEFDDYTSTYRVRQKSNNNNTPNVFTSLFYSMFCAWKIFEVIIFKDKPKTISEK